MKRIEIIANHSVEEDLLEALALAHVARNYTVIPTAHGSGRQGRKTGDTTWPEENFILFVWCEEEEARAIGEVVASIKAKFPHEGIKLFVMG
jgi:nitrogen regulatory protein PII